jgi:hypothetical protein
LTVNIEICIKLSTILVRERNMGEGKVGGSEDLPGEATRTAVSPSQVELFKRSEIKRSVKDLFSDSDIVVSDAINELTKFGSESVTILVEELLKKSLSSAVRENIITALKEIGKPSIEPMLSVLNNINELTKPEDIYLMEDIARVLTALKDKRVEPLIITQINKLNNLIAKKEQRMMIDICEAVKIRLHQMLCELGSRGGLEDLILLLGDGRKRVREGVIDAIARIGDKRAILPLLRLYEIELGLSESGARNIKNAFREIVRRENVAYNDPVLANLGKTERETFEKLYPKHKTNGHNHFNQVKTPSSS